MVLSNYSYLITIYLQLYSVKCSYLILIFYTQLYGLICITAYQLMDYLRQKFDSFVNV